MTLLREWTERLGLQDWIIKLVTECVQDDMCSNDSVSGEVEYTPVNKSAVIRILSEEEYGDRVIPFDFEKTLVHELLHLKFYHLDTLDEIANNVTHVLIDDLARALVMAKRGTCKRGTHSL